MTPPTKAPAMTEVEVKVADWAIEKACQLMGIDARTLGERERLSRGSGYVLAFARYIEAHEEQPVDPLLAEAGSIIQNWRNGNAGEDDAVDTARLVLAALRRGIELAGQTP